MEKMNLRIMNEQDRELLIIDLCGRLPYGVKCKIGNYNYVICDISFEKQYDVFYNSGRHFPIGVIGTEDNGNTFHTSVYEKHVKPYLFPMSSMTEEQKIIYGDFVYEIVSSNPLEIQNRISNLHDWLNKNHFDYRGLIEKGLAIDATNLNIY